MRHSSSAALTLCVFMSGALAQEAAKPAPAAAKDKVLPKVVLLGDSVREHYAPFVAELLAGRAVVVTP
jgi:lysophospholipase L1-like esterase